VSMTEYGRDEVITDIAKLIAGLQVPVSLNGRVMLGVGLEPWERLFHHLHTFGWTDDTQLEKELRAILDEAPPKPERNIALWVRIDSNVDAPEWVQRGHYSSLASARRGVRKWREQDIDTYIQLPGEPEPTELNDPERWSGMKANQ
jgi:hypothetical protein